VFLRECERIFVKPVDRLIAEELRFLLLNDIALIVVVDITLNTLEKDPTTIASLGRCDLLESLIGVNSDFWVSSPALLNRFLALQDDINELQATLSERIIPKIKAEALFAGHSLERDINDTYFPHVTGSGLSQ
jgi:hypothetical protein